MRLAASCAGIAMAWFAVASAQAACLNANEPDQSAEGRLTSVSISIPVYKLKEQAAILRLSSVACLEAAASSTRSKRTSGSMCLRWTMPCGGCFASLRASGFA